MAVISGSALLRLRAELDQLVHVDRPQLLGELLSAGGRDAADQADRAQAELALQALDARIERLTGRLFEAAPAPVGVEDGVVSEGHLVRLDFGDGAPTPYIVGDLDAAPEGIDVVTPTSPLGSALLGAHVGESVQVSTPRGPMTVLIVALEALAASAAA